jgi:origin recognition complex subunit 2
MILGLIEHQGPKGTVQDQLSLIHAYFTKESRKVPNLVLLIHNIDGPSLRNAKAQSLLSVLADTPNIRLIASIDHINAPLLWDSVLTKRFNWIWHDVTSFAPWIQETTFETSILIKSSSLGPRGVIYVLKSLNANARGVCVVFALASRF